MGNVRKLEFLKNYIYTPENFSCLVLHCVKGVVQAVAP
jgi:hypothetical protein